MAKILYDVKKSRGAYTHQPLSKEGLFVGVSLHRKDVEATVYDGYGAGDEARSI